MTRTKLWHLDQANSPTRIYEVAINVLLSSHLHSDANSHLVDIVTALSNGCHRCLVHFSLYLCPLWVSLLVNVTVSLSTGDSLRRLLPPHLQYGTDLWCGSENIEVLPMSSHIFRPAEHWLWFLYLGQDAVDGRNMSLPLLGDHHQPQNALHASCIYFN